MIQDKALEFHNATAIGNSADEAGEVIDLGHDHSNLGVYNTLVVVVSFSDDGINHANPVTAILETNDSQNGGWVAIATKAKASKDIVEGEQWVIPVPAKTGQKLRLKVTAGAAGGIGNSGTVTARIALDYDAQHAYPAGSVI